MDGGEKIFSSRMATTPTVANHILAHYGFAPPKRLLHTHSGITGNETIADYFASFLRIEKWKLLSSTEKKPAKTLISKLVSNAF